LGSIPYNQDMPRSVYFIDDNLCLTLNKLVRFAQAIIDNKLNLQWRGFLRADMIDKKTAFLLKESGCYEVSLGIESGDTQILSNMNKRFDPEKALRGICALDAAGIRTISNFVVGYPGECTNSIKNTTAFISSIPSGQKANAFHQYYLFRFMVSPLTPVASIEKRKKYGLKGIAEKWKHDTMTAYEAKKAIREIFLTVEGPSHLYFGLESFPTDWSHSAIREIIELRDRIKKDQLLGKNTKIENLLKAVKKVEENKYMEV
jgi:p-methyltransferase